VSIPFGFSPNPGDNNDFAAMFENMGRMLRNVGKDNGSVDWQSARDSIKRTIKTDPAILDRDQQSMKIATELADLWLNDANRFGISFTNTKSMGRRNF
jgi:uncharacterized protein (DUF2342 family)